MKTILLALLASLLFLVARPAALGADEEQIAAGELLFPGSDARMVLEVYRDLARVELVIDSRVERIDSPISYTNRTPLGRKEAMKSIEGALLKQAGIVITHLEDGKVSVTYNDALLTVPADKQGSQPVVKGGSEK